MTTTTSLTFFGDEDTAGLARIGDSRRDGGRGRLGA
jgi:hypothetical protein